MKIDFSSALINLDGGSFKGPDGEPLKLWEISIEALNAIEKAEGREKQLNAAEKVRRGELCVKLYKAGVVDLSAEDVALIKEKCIEIAKPILAKRLADIFDGKSAQ